MKQSAGKGKENGMRLKLSESVFFSSVGDRVYVRDVDSHKDYLFEGSAYDIMTLLRKQCSLSELLDCLRRGYNIKDEEEFESAIRSFIDILIKDNLVVVDGFQSNLNRIGIGTLMKQEAMKLRRLWSVTLELTYRCNQHCIHCYLDDEKDQTAEGELTGSEWKRVVDECAELGCMNVLVTGGEPTLHREFLDVCRYVVSKGMLLDVYTNGLFISDEIFDALLKLKLNSVSVSLYGGSAEFHDSITRVSGSYDRTLMTALKFKSAGKDMFIKTVLFRNHIDEYFKLKKIASRYGMIVSPASIITGSRSGRSNADLIITNEEFKRLLQEDESFRSSSECGVGRDINGPVCMAGQNALSVDPFGKVFPCNALHLEVGNIRVHSISDIWEKSEKLSEVRNIRLADISSSCKICDCVDICSCCLGAAYAENNGDLGRFIPVCDQTKVRSRFIKQTNNNKGEEK